MVDVKMTVFYSRSHTRQVDRHCRRKTAFTSTVHDSCAECIADVCLLKNMFGHVERVFYNDRTSLSTSQRSYLS